MPDDTGSSGWPGIIAAAGSALAAAVVSVFALWAKIGDARRDRATDRERENLDEHQRSYLDRLEKRIASLENQVAEAEERVQHWEAAARLQSKVAHNLRHELNNYRHKSGVPDVAFVPKLDAPLKPDEV